MIVAFVTCSIEIPCLKLSKETVEYIYTYLHQQVQKCYDRKLRSPLFFVKVCIVRCKVLFVYYYATSNHTLSLSLDIGNLWSTDCLPLASTCVHPRVFVGSMFLIVVVFCVVLCIALWKCLSISLRICDKILNLCLYALEENRNINLICSRYQLWSLCSVNNDLSATYSTFLTRSDWLTL